MGIIHRYRTAWSRHHRSGGFGIHSPFAYWFVLHVLRQRLPYYAYDDITALRQAVLAALGKVKRERRVITNSQAQLLFRVTNAFNPPLMMAIGTSYGIDSASMMAVSSNSHLYLYDPQLERYPITVQALGSHLQRIDCYDDLIVATDDYWAKVDKAGAEPYVLVSVLPQGCDPDQVATLLQRVIDGGGVVVMRELHRDQRMSQLWHTLASYAKEGQGFTNEQMGIFIAHHKLPRQDFLLWL